MDEDNCTKTTICLSTPEGAAVGTIYVVPLSWSYAALATKVVVAARHQSAAPPVMAVLAMAKMSVFTAAHRHMISTCHHIQVIGKQAKHSSNAHSLSATIVGKFGICWYNISQNCCQHSSLTMIQLLAAYSFLSSLAVRTPPMCQCQGCRGTAPSSDLLYCML
eukprot:GHRR01007652.1.p1 GENE.GHRR01007652.1~~GHRR01007652.1.p1  ORF type:complete len:163 (+),score=22.87 GHRR01007652.1:767-1255(+)